MKWLVVGLVLVAVLLAAYPVQAGACDPQPVWVNGSGDAAINQDFTVEFEGLSSLNFLMIDTAYSYQIIVQNAGGFTARLLPISTERADIGAYTYYAFGYQDVACYYINLPLVVH